MSVDVVMEDATEELNPVGDISTKTENRPLFVANEKILIFHGPLIYEGKILIVREPQENNDPSVGFTYLIHYSGWNKKWDELVPQTRILKYNEENLRRQKEHKIAYEATLRSGTGKKADGKLGGGAGKPSLSVSTPKNPASVAGDSVSNASVGDSGDRDPSNGVASGVDDTSKGSKNKSYLSFSLPPSLLPAETIQKKKKLEAHIESEARFVNKQVVELPLPERLKMVLVDDFDRINRQKRLLKIPGRHSIDAFLESYKSHLKVTLKTPDSQFLFVDGVKDFFNMLIGGHLLYPYERQQYGELFQLIKESEERAKENTENTEGKLMPLTMTAFYGPVHLIRLFSKLESSLAFTTMEEVPLLIFKRYAQDLFFYMTQNESDLFQPRRDYSISSPEYQRNGPTEEEP